MRYSEVPVLRHDNLRQSPLLCIVPGTQGYCRCLYLNSKCSRGKLLGLYSCYMPQRSIYMNFIQLTVSSWRFQQCKAMRYLFRVHPEQLDYCSCYQLLLLCLPRPYVLQPAQKCLLQRWTLSKQSSRLIRKPPTSCSPSSQAPPSPRASQPSLTRSPIQPATTRTTK